MNLYRKHRPKEFNDIFGNEDVVESLQNIVKKRNTHSFLLHGETGCGKTTLGRIIAKKLNSYGADFREIDTADFRGIDTIREIRKQAQYKPIESDCRVFLIDESHKLTIDAQNALLKILEDTPNHVYFILATTEPQKLISTIKGRCSQFALKPLNDKQMLRLLRKIVREEKEHINKEVYNQIVLDSLGHPRNALQILEQVLNVDEEKRLKTAKRSAEKQSQSIELCRALLNRPSWKKVNTILKGLKQEDPEGIRRVVLGYCQSVLLNGENDQAGLIMEEFIEPFYNTGFPGLTFACYSVLRG